MNILIFGAGAIGSLIGANLSKNNNVILIGRKSHISSIKKNKLIIKGKTNLKVKINAKETVDDLKFKPDILILTVKSYDTEHAILQVKNIISENTIVLSLQNGLDNIDKIRKYISFEKIIVGVTTHGAFFSKPGIIRN
jgi:2-dehydropantoate 2-reductase